VFFDDTGKTTLYCQVVKADTLYIWNSSAYVATPDTWALSTIALTESSFVKGLYYANMPTSTRGHYIIICREYSGSAANTDVIISVYDMIWDGVKELFLTEKL
jgi:hypothetical protein